MTMHGERAVAAQRAQGEAQVLHAGRRAPAGRVLRGAASIACATPPKRTSACRRASSGAMPSAEIVLDGGLEVGGDLGFEVAIERSARGTSPARGPQIRRIESIIVRSSFGRKCEHAAHQAGQPSPVGGVLGQLLAALARDGVELGLAVVVGDAPFGGDPAPLLQADECGVDGPLVQQHLLAADLFDAARDAVAMQRAHARECLQDHQVQRSLEEFESLFAHVDLRTCGPAT